MTFLFDFNRFYLIPFLTDWLGLQEYGRLETSCNGACRSQLNLLKSQYPSLFSRSFVNCAEVPISTNMVGWLLRHGYEFSENTLMMMRDEKEYASLFLKYNRQQIKQLFKSLRRVHCILPTKDSHLKAYPTMLLSYCTNVESLSMSHVHNRSYFLLDTIARDFLCLTELSLTHCRKLCASTLIPIIRNCRQLLSLDLNCSEVECHRKFMNTLIIYGAALQKLRFGIVMPAKRDLVRLAVFGRCKLTCYDVTCLEELLLLRFKGKHLTDLRLSCYRNIFAFGGDSLLQSCPSLTNLYIEYFLSTTFPSVLSLSHPVSLLRVTICSANFNDECLSLLVAQCPHLQALDLRLAFLSSDGLLLITKLPEIVALTLRQILSLNGDTLSEILKHCKKLRALDISCNEQILDADIQIIMPHLKSLFILNLLGCNESSATHHSLMQLCPHLKELYVLTVLRDAIAVDIGDYSPDIRRFLVSVTVKGSSFLPMGVDMISRCNSML